VIRTLAVVVSLGFACGPGAAGDRSAHETEHSRAPDADLDELKRTLAEIIQRQEGFRDGLSKEFYHRHPSRVLQKVPTVGDIPTVTIPKGGYARVEHTISWHQYPNDELEVRLTASDATILVPARIDVDFEKHQFRFSYEITAGDKVGEYTVLLTPAAGRPVTVKVIVK
jgi:hypothetical protein